jgi:hypothetical protein
MVVDAIDDDHVHRRPPERLGGEQPTEAAADDDNPVRTWCSVRR